jgi:heptosyltransferase-2
MATPTFRALRRALPGAFIGALCRPGLDDLLAGTDFFDELHVDRPRGMMGPKRIAGRLRIRRYDAAVLLTNSFSTALITRLAGIPRRFGYDRDARGLLLTDRLEPRKRRDTPPFNRSKTAPNDWAPIPACEYYFTIAQRLLRACATDPGDMGPMELAVTDEQQQIADVLLESIGAKSGLAILNPGGNNPAKRWPAKRFAAVADYLVRERNLTILLSGSPDERDLLAEIASQADSATRPRIINLAESGALTLGSLKGVIARCRLMITNDTGPRHIAAAFGVPVVTLFGPTDHRWTTIPFKREAILLADSTLPEEEVANDHPDRCAVDRITVEEVLRASESLLI